MFVGTNQRLRRPVYTPNCVCNKSLSSVDGIDLVLFPFSDLSDKFSAPSTQHTFDKMMRRRMTAECISESRNIDYRSGKEVERHFENNLILTDQLPSNFFINEVIMKRNEGLFFS